MLYSLKSIYYIAHKKEMYLLHCKPYDSRHFHNTHIYTHTLTYIFGFLLIQISHDELVDQERKSM